MIVQEKIAFTLKLNVCLLFNTTLNFLKKNRHSYKYVFIRQMQDIRYEYVKVLMAANHVLPSTRYIFEASYSTSVTWVNKIQSMDQSELRNLLARIEPLIYSYCICPLTFAIIIFCKAHDTSCATHVSNNKLRNSFYGKRFLVIPMK